MSVAVPDPTTQGRGVTVEEIVSGTRCSPLTLKEFEGFLIHEEHSVENLQFTVWYRSYCERFAALPAAYRALSDPPAEPYSYFKTPTASINTTGSKNGWFSKLTRRSSSGNVKALKGVATPGGSKLEAFELEMRQNDEGRGLDKKEVDSDRDSMSFRHACASTAAVDVEGIDDFAVPRTAASPFQSIVRPRPQAVREKTDGSINDDARSASPNAIPPLERARTSSDTSSVAASDKLKKPFPTLRFANLLPISTRPAYNSDTPLPFADEVGMVVATFFLPGSPKELNIDSRLRKHILRSLQPIDENGQKGSPVTTHPDVFKEAAEHTYELMEGSLPHYLTWAKGNTNTPKVLFWYAVGTTDMGIGIMVAMITLYFARSRWWRLFSFLFFQFGVMQSYSASRYFCSQVHGRTARQLYPWELTAQMEETAEPTLNSSGAVIPSIKVDGGTGAPMPSFHVPASENTRDLLMSWEKPEETVNPETYKQGGSFRTPAVFRSKIFAMWKKADGKRVPVFGPERVVEDPYIKYLHNQQIKEILIVGAIATFLFECIVLSIPERTPL